MLKAVRLYIINPILNLNVLNVLSVHHFATIHMHHLSAYIRRVIRSKVYVSGSQFIRLPWPLHWLRCAELTYFFSSNVDGMSGVQIGPGATALTRIPFSITFIDSERVNEVIAPLVDE